MPTKYQAPDIRDSIKRDILEGERTLKDQHLSQGLNVPAFRKTVEGEKELLESITPVPVTGEAHNKLAERQAQLEAAMTLGSAKQGIPRVLSQREHWGKPTGATHQHTLWEKTWKHKTLDATGKVVPATDGYGAVFEWKDNQRKLYPDREEDIDLCNVGQLFPEDVSGDNINGYTRRTYTLPNISYEKWLEQHPEAAPPKMGVKAGLYKGWTVADDGKVVKEAEDLKNKLHTFETCQAKTAKGEPCKRKPVDANTPWCSPAHEAQIKGAPLGV